MNMKKKPKLGKPKHVPVVRETPEWLNCSAPDVEAYIRLHLPSHETKSDVVTLTNRLVNEMLNAGLGRSGIIHTLRTCQCVSCGSVACPVCQRLFRGRFAKHYTPIFDRLRQKGWDIYLLTIVPADAVVSQEALSKISWARRRKVYKAMFSRAVEGLEVKAIVAPDIDLRKGVFSLHLHAVCAVRNYGYRAFTERLVQEFNPLRIGGAYPVKKVPIEDGLPSALTYVVKGMVSVASKVRKRRGVYTGKREVPYRIFLDSMTFANRTFKVWKKIPTQSE